MLMAPSSSELISALGHPLRRRILLAYLDEPMARASAGEIAEAFDERVGEVAYHLKTLVKTEILRPLHDDGWKRAQQTRYRLAGDVEVVWLRLALEVWAETELMP
jgi:DNA-binding transcriptional ArsR family regulator